MALVDSTASSSTPIRCNEPKPIAFCSISDAPKLDVIIKIVFWKLTVLPSLLVNLPSSIICNSNCNTSGAALIADGTNFNPVVISGDISIATNGAASIAANSVDGTHIALGSDAAGDIMYYNGTNYIRLAKGDDDQVLTLASGVPSWGTSSGIGMGKAIAAALVFG